MAVTKLRLGTIYTGVPGAYSEVDRSGLDQIGFGATGICAILGEADAGGAGGGTTVQSLNSPQAFRNTFRAGDLYEVGEMMFNPSNDRDVPGGASSTRVVRVNPSVVGTAMFTNAAGDAMLITSDDSGAFVNQMNFLKGSGTVQGEQWTEALEAASETIDNIGGDPWFQCLYTPDAAGYSTALVTVGVDGLGNPDKVTLDVGATVAMNGTQTATYDNNEAGDVNSAAGGDNGLTCRIYGVDADGRAITIDVVVTGGAQTAFTELFTAICGVELRDATGALTAAAGQIDIRDTTGPTITNSILIATSSTGIQYHTSAGVAGRPVTVICNAAGRYIIVRGTDRSGNVQMEAMLNPGAGGTATQSSWNSITEIMVGDVAAGTNTTFSGIAAEARITQSSGTTTTGALAGETDNEVVSGSTVEVLSSQAGDVTQIVTVYGFDTSGDAQTGTAALNGVTAVATTETWSRITGAVCDSGLTGIITVRRPSAGAAILVASGAGIRRIAVRDQINYPVNGTTVTLTGSAGAGTRHVKLVGLSAAGAAQTEDVTLSNAVAVVTTNSWSRISRIEWGNVATGQTVTIAIPHPLDGSHTTIQQLADNFNAKAGVTVTIGTPAPTTDLIAELDIPAAATDVRTITADFDAQLTELIRAINLQSRYVTATRPNGATGAPTDTPAGAPVFLSGGSNGTTLFAHWQAALNSLRAETDVNAIVVLTSNAAVHAALNTHLAWRAAAGVSEANGFAGLPTGSTKTAIDALILAINSRHISPFGQEIQRFNAAGVATWFAPYFQAAIMAAMQCGAVVNMPMTRKFVDVLDVRQDSSWSPAIDKEDMLDMNLSFMEKVPSRGIRWVRSVTSWRQDTNLANIEQSVNHAVNVFIRDFRTQLDLKVGQPGFSGTITAIKALSRALLNLAVREGRIFSYRSLSVTLEADSVPVAFEVAVVSPINFIPITAHLVMADLDAA